MTVEVALPLPIDSSFSYHVPTEWKADIARGYRVVVPFGPRTLTGVVVDIRDEDSEDPADLKSIEDVPDDYPALTPPLVELTRWIADYYVCAHGEAIRAALPPGIEIESESVIERSDRPADEAEVGSPEEQVLQYLEGRGSVSVSAVRKRFPFLTSAKLNRLMRDDFVHVVTRVRGPRARAKLVRFVRLDASLGHPDAAREAMLGLRGVKQRAVMLTLLEHQLAGDAEVALADVLSTAKASTATINSLREKHYIEVFTREEDRKAFPDEDVALASAPELHGAQRRALDQITESIREGRFETFLLHGVTGSGKTEVYISALEATLEEGRSGIILVPEISLTPQMVTRFRGRFGDAISVLHSRMSVGERYDAWRAVREGRHRIVIGPRSAVFAPVERLGLIVVDEEHESSYKQFDPAPRYHARDVAVMRAHLEGAACVLGSATPSLESHANGQHGKYHVIRMPDRVPVGPSGPAVLPKVEIVDLTLERKKHRLEGTLSLPLREAIRERLDRSEQVILLQNRRGYSPVVECEACGHSPACPDCAVTFTYHKFTRRLRCHYCGRTQHLPVNCAACGKREMRQLGAGTQRVEEELATCFPDGRVVRMDLDTTHQKHAHHRILDRFGRGEADILLGTQMVAKGLDFGKVTLVGVVNADTELLLPDFRSEERTFQLLTQVAGRAGRADRPGEVILQTRNAGNPALDFARAHDYDGFAEHAMRGRKELGYPPYGQITVVEFSGPVENETSRLGTEWTGIFRQQAADILVLGPHPAFIQRVKRRYRYQTVIRSRHRQRDPDLQGKLRAANAAFGAPSRDYRIAIDVDAVGIN